MQTWLHAIAQAHTYAAVCVYVKMWQVDWQPGTLKKCVNIFFY